MYKLNPIILPVNPLSNKIAQWAIKNPTNSMIMACVGITLTIIIIATIIYINKKDKNN